MKTLKLIHIRYLPTQLSKATILMKMKILSSSRKENFLIRKKLIDEGKNNI